MEREGIQVQFATTSYSPDMTERDPRPLEVLAELGIRSFRMTYFQYDDKTDLLVQFAQVRRQMEIMADQCPKRGIKAVYQVHHGYNQLIQNSSAALAILQGLPSKYVGVMLDPGNQFHEGKEHNGRAVSIRSRGGMWTRRPISP